MCDYSPYTTQTRLPEDGEELVLHTFETGTLGFAPASDLLNLQSGMRSQPDGFWASIKQFLWARRSTRLPAVCIPPGTRLLLGDLPRTVQASLCIAPSEVVVFTELSNRSYSYRDALLLPNGTRVLLQDLPEGLHAIVLSTSSQPSAKPEHAELYAA